MAHAPELAEGNRSRELLTRAFHPLSCGEVAVDSFFLLSGYLMVQSWERWLIAFQRQDADTGARRSRAVS